MVKKPAHIRFQSNRPHAFVMYLFFTERFKHRQW